MRALILAGGGLKVAYQAGALEVLLDEAGLTFEYVDGASGGCLNAAMWAQGLSGAQIADRWRTLDPTAGIDVHWTAYQRPFFGESLFTLDAYRDNVFPAWELDFTEIRRRKRPAGFNVYNFTKHEVRVIPAAELTEDALIASISLPMWFPPVTIDGDTYIDAVYATDANIEEAICRGADDLYVIWTVSQTGAWRDGFVEQYFQIIEASANSNYKRLKERIARSNQAIDAGTTGEFTKTITLRELRAEVPLHYLINFSRDRIAESVNRGVQQARAWCKEQGIPLTPGRTHEEHVHEHHTTLTFTEDMRGHVTIGATDPDHGRTDTKRTPLHCHLTVRIECVHHFITDPQREATITGYVQWDATRSPVTKGTFNLFVDDGDPTIKYMRYTLRFQRDNKEHTLHGEKTIKNDPGPDVWHDTTTLRLTISTNGTIAAGVITINEKDFRRQLASFDVQADSIAERFTALTAFGRFFLGSLWATHGATPWSIL